jgi:hypothetical protein
MKNLVPTLTLACLFSAVVTAIASAPAAMGFGVVVAGSAAWCRWLERHPQEY